VTWLRQLLLRGHSNARLSPRVYGAIYIGASQLFRAFEPRSDKEIRLCLPVLVPRVGARSETTTPNSRPKFYRGHLFSASSTLISLIVCRCRSDSGTSRSTSYWHLAFPNARIARGDPKQYPAPLNMVLRQYQSSWQLRVEPPGAIGGSVAHGGMGTLCKINTLRFA
jgi:hypothetical protein